MEAKFLCKKATFIYFFLIEFLWSVLTGNCRLESLVRREGYYCRVEYNSPETKIPNTSIQTHPKIVKLIPYWEGLARFQFFRLNCPYFLNLSCDISLPTPCPQIHPLCDLTLFSLTFISIWLISRILQSQVST